MRQIERWDGEHFAGLVRLAALANGRAAEEVVQAVFVALHGNPPALRTPDRPLPYLRAAVLNRKRSQAKRLAIGARVGRRWFAGTASDDVEQAAVSRTAGEEVLDAVRHLPTRQRDVVMLRYWLDVVRGRHRRDTPDLERNGHVVSQSSRHDPQPHPRGTAMMRPEHEATLREALGREGSVVDAAPDWDEVVRPASSSAPRGGHGRWLLAVAAVIVVTVVGGVVALSDDGDRTGVATAPDADGRVAVDVDGGTIAVTTSSDGAPCAELTVDGRLDSWFGSRGICTGRPADDGLVGAVVGLENGMTVVWGLVPASASGLRSTVDPPTEPRVALSAPDPRTGRPVFLVVIDAVPVSGRLEAVAQDGHVLSTRHFVETEITGINPLCEEPGDNSCALSEPLN